MIKQFVGTGIDVKTKEKKIVLSGKDIFFLMDSKGLHLDDIVLELKLLNLSFDVIEFIDCALKSKNFTYEKIKKRLLYNIDPKYKDDFIKDLEKIEKIKNWK